MFEADLVLLRYSFLKLGRCQDWLARWQFWNLALSRHGFTNRGDLPVAKNFHDAFIAVYKQFAARKGATIWGDKSPNYYDRIQELAEEFPTAKFIIVWRDPVATANAVVRAGLAGSPYFNKKGMKLRSLMGYRVLKRGCDHLRDIGRDACEINYEDLVREPSSVMQVVCQYLQIPYMQEVSDLRDADRSSVPESKHHALLQGETIVSEQRREVLDPSFRAKARRYANWWQLWSGGEWPPFPPAQSCNMAFPGISERTWDWISYKMFRGFDALTRLAFCFVPLSWLARYRKFARKKYQAAGNFEKEKKDLDLAFEFLNQSI